MKGLRLLCVALMIFSCDMNKEKLNAQWYLVKVINLESNLEVTQKGCQYLFLNADNTFESRGFIKQKGNWGKEDYKLILSYSNGKEDELEIESISESELITISSRENNTVKFTFSKVIPDECL